MTNIDPIAISKLAAGTFISDLPPKIMADMSPHTLVKYIQGTRATREAIITSHVEVESILIISHDQLSELFIPTLCTDFNPATYSTVIRLGGAKGYQVTDPYPTSFEASIILADFNIFHDENHRNITFFKGAQFPKAYFDDLSDDYPFSTTTKAPITISRCPLIIPKLKGYKITKGSIYQNEVQESLKNYHPAALAWLKFFLLPERNVFIDDASMLPVYLPSFDEDKLQFQRLKTRKFVERSELADSLDTSIREKILEKVERIRSSNEELFYAQNPDKDWRNFNSPQKSKNSRNVPPEIEIESTKPEPTKDKYKRYLSFYLLFLSSSRQGRSNTPRTQVVQPTISNDMIEAYALSKADMAQHVRHNLNRFADKKMEDSHYLNRLINFPYFNQATAILIAFCEFDTSPIAQNKNSHSQSITALTFLPAPKSGSTFYEYQKYVDKARDTRMEKAIGEAAEKCGTMDKKSFVNGSIETFEDALTCVANRVCCLKFFCTYTAGDRKPDIIKILEKFADLITTRKFRKFVDENISGYPWIPLTLVCYVQTILVSFVEIAIDTTNQRLIENDEEVSVEFFDEPWMTYKDIAYDIKLSLTSSTPRAFATPPNCWNSGRNNGHNKKRTNYDNTSSPLPQSRDRKRQKFDGTKKGWLVSSVGSDFRFPRLSHGKIPCKNFALIGHEYTHSGCTFGHSVFPGNFNRDDQSTLMKWVANNASIVKFSDTVDKKFHSNHTTSGKTDDNDSNIDDNNSTDE